MTGLICKGTRENTALDVVDQLSRHDVSFGSAALMVDISKR